MSKTSDTTTVDLLDIPDPELFRELSRHLQNWRDTHERHLQQLASSHDTLMSHWKGDGAQSYSHFHNQMQKIGEMYLNQESEVSMNMDQTADKLEEANRLQEIVIGMAVGTVALIGLGIITFGLSDVGAAAAAGSAATIMAEVAAIIAEIIELLLALFAALVATLASLGPMAILGLIAMLGTITVEALIAMSPGTPVKPLNPRPAAPPSPPSPNELLTPTLQTVPAGQHALDIQKEYGVKVIWGKPGEGSYYNSLDNTVVLDPTTPPDTVAAVYVHEMTHAEYYNGPNKYIDPHKLSRDDYINAKINEETNATFNAILYNEQRKKLTGKQGLLPLQKEYEQAYNNIYNVLKEKYPHATPDQLDEAAQIVGWQRVHDAYMKGEVLSSTTHLPYPVVYGAHWDIINRGEPVPENPQ